jgi:hypothetical protein
MKTSKTVKFLIPCIGLLAAAVAQATEPPASAVTGQFTTKLYFFDFSGDGLARYLQGYGSQESWSGNRNSGLYGDVDLSLRVSNSQRDTLVLERQGFGLDNHRARLRGGSDAIGFSGYYSHYRSNAGAVNYVNRPGTENNPAATGYTVGGNAGYLSRFNDDTAGQPIYHVERTRYGVGVKFKPDLMGAGTSLAVNFDGYQRDGATFATWVAGNSDISPVSADQRQARWRGYDKPVDENMGRISMNFTAAPGGMFHLAYDGSFERFRNSARIAEMGDFQSAIEGTGTAPTGLTLASFDQLHFVPDSTLVSQSLRLSKTMGSTALAAGYGMSRLRQDSFSLAQIDAGFDKGRINTSNAFVSLNHRFSPTISVEGHVKYHDRENDSDAAPPDGVLDRGVRDEWGVRIANIDSLDYGLAASIGRLPVKSTLTAGWRRRDVERDLRYNDITAAPNIGVVPEVSLYQSHTDSDEFYLKWVARPARGTILRVTPSYVTASKTGFVTEPEKSLNLKLSLSHALQSGVQLSGYYHLKDKKNDNNSFFDTSKPTGGPIVTGPEYKQKADEQFHAAGLSLTFFPSEWVNINAGVNWAQNDFETYYFGTNARRFESNIVFDRRGVSAFKADTLSFSLTGDYQVSDELKFVAGYALDLSDGDLTTSTTALNDVVRDKIDHSLHSFNLGMHYLLARGSTLRVGYMYEKYKDDVYDNISGSAHTVMMGFSMPF